VEPAKPDTGSAKSEKQAKPSTVKATLQSQVDRPVNPPSTDKDSSVGDKQANPVEGKPKIATKPVLAPRFFDKTVNLRAVLQNGLGLKPAFKIRPMLSLSR
jgi:hypothetical protein